MLMQNKVAIVTGSSHGIGRAIAEMFAAEGAKTVLAARRKEKLDEVVAGITKKGGTAMAIPTDVTVESQVIDLFARAKKAYGRIDVVVNNAGTANKKPTDEISLENWSDAIALNLTGVFLCSREAVRHMKAQGPQGGRIINMGSISTKSPRPDHLTYTTTKAAVRGLTNSLTLDGRKYGVVASIVNPGQTFSGMTERWGRTGPGAGDAPEDYIMDPTDVARVTVLMASLPDEVNLYEATILSNQTRSFLGRG